jgi:outer membrane protein assembly factor BamB
MVKKMLALMFIMACCLPMQCCWVGEFLADLPKTPFPERTLDVNDEYDVIWSLPNTYIDGCAWHSMVAGGPGMIFVQARLSKLDTPSLLAIDSLKGNIVWQIDPSSKIGGSDGIILTQDKVLYRVTNGAAVVQAFDTTDGALVWETDLPGAHSADELYFADNKIFVHTVDNEFFTLTDQGKIIGHTTTSGTTVYVEMDSILYRLDTAIRAINIASEHELWHVNEDTSDPFRSSPIFDAGTIFLRTANVDGSIYSIDQYTGKVNWNVSRKMYSNLFVAGEKIYFISPDGHLVAINRNSGTVLSKATFSTPLDSSDYGKANCITGDSTNNTLAVAFIDSNQVLGLKIKKP